MTDDQINIAMKIMYDSATRDKRKLKALVRKKLPDLSSQEAMSLVEEVREIERQIYIIAGKSFANVPLSKEESKYMGSLRFDGRIKSEIWKSATFAQFR